jgi:hypothetical protein
MNSTPKSFLQITGQVLVIASVAGFAAAVVLSTIPASINYSGGIAADGTIAAISAIFLFAGAAFSMPSLLLEDSKDANSFSTIRFMVLIVGIVFAAITVKIGWQTASFEDFKVHSTWVYIIGITLGAKVTQRFAEDE